MGKYHVHVYPVVRVLIKDIEADSQEEACKKAEELVDLHQLFESLRFDPPVGYVEYADEIDGFLVDEESDVEHELSTWYEKDYTPSPPERR